MLGHMEGLMMRKVMRKLRVYQDLDDMKPMAGIEDITMMMQEGTMMMAEGTIKVMVHTREVKLNFLLFMVRVILIHT